MADLIKTINDGDEVPNYSEESDEEIEVCNSCKLITKYAFF